MAGNLAESSDFHATLGIFYMPQICDMGPTALLPFRRKACWGFSHPEKSDGFDRVRTKGQHATSRLQKPLRHVCYKCTFIVFQPEGCPNPDSFFFNGCSDSKNVPQNMQHHATSCGWQCAWKLHTYFHLLSRRASGSAISLQKETQTYKYPVENTSLHHRSSFLTRFHFTLTYLKPISRSVVMNT